MLLLETCLFLEKIIKQYKNNKPKIIAPTQNDKFELSGSSYSVSDIQDYIKYIIKKHKALTRIPPIHVYIKMINYRLVFKIKDGYKLELQAPETMKLFSSTKKLIDEKKKMEKMYQVLKQLKQFQSNVI